MRSSLVLLACLSSLFDAVQFSEIQTRDLPFLNFWFLPFLGEVIATSNELQALDVSNQVTKLMFFNWFCCCLVEVPMCRHSDADSDVAIGDKNRNNRSPNVSPVVTLSSISPTSYSGAWGRCTEWALINQNTDNCPYWRVWFTKSTRGYDVWLAPSKS